MRTLTKMPPKKVENITQNINKSNGNIPEK
jgi:hypothetical protein